MPACSPEARPQSKLLRKRLDAIFREWRIPFAKCIAEAQTAVEIDSRFDATELAEFLLASWEGAILRMRVERGPAALERCKKIMFETVVHLGPGAHYLQEDHPQAIGSNVKQWLTDLGVADQPAA
jgi:Tetracyclin repressor-like, C-terminal domain